EMECGISFKGNIFTSNILSEDIRTDSGRFYLSANQQFLKTIKNGITTVWNLLTGKREPNLGNRIIWEQVKLSQTDIDMDNPKNNMWFYGGGSFEDEGISVIMVRQTLQAIVCRMALLNSFCNKQELTELYHSKTFKNLTG